MQYYKVKNKEIKDKEDMSHIVPEINLKYRLIHSFRDNGYSVVETDKEPNPHEEKIQHDDPVVTSHLNWWAAHPEDDPGWIEVN